MTTPTLAVGTITRTTIGAENKPCANLTCSICGLIARVIIDDYTGTPHPLRAVLRDFWKIHQTIRHAVNLELDVSLVT